ncbi:fused MFS/spermidine synthase [Kitasatospora sp. GAS204B]|uniref:spermidine synthase n=1 Tax=unclassified Kitasatospora TaxID=2633591 RepID=UPI0024768B56|nr:fused MFS/spermidine synthase [Kitasatospora sp. GAS204B]MDH6119155.1 spermidine synthase [Kitasatospora sp. GAS204B]
MPRDDGDRHTDQTPGERVPVQRETAFGTAKLMPDLDDEGGWLLTLDGTPQSYVDLAEPGHLEFEYTQRLGHLADTLAPEGRALAVLHLGGGALTLPRYLAASRPGSRQQVAEADGPLVELVREVLPWPEPEITVTVGDARDVLAGTAPGSLDLVIADVFQGSRTPAHLTSTEFVRHVAAALRPDGTYAANLADSAPLDFARAQAATVREVFPHSCLIAEPSVLRGRRYGNLLLIGSPAPLPVEPLARRLAGDPFPARLVDGAELRRLVGPAVPVTDAAARPSPPPPAGAFSIG